MLEWEHRSCLNVFVKASLMYLTHTFAHGFNLIWWVLIKSCCFAVWSWDLLGMWVPSECRIKFCPPAHQLTPLVTSTNGWVAMIWENSLVGQIRLPGRLRLAYRPETPHPCTSANDWADTTIWLNASRSCESKPRSFQYFQFGWKSEIMHCPFPGFSPLSF